MQIPEFVYLANSAIIESLKRN